jgi:hypothetical protein
MIASEFLAYVQGLGGQVYVKGDDLSLHMPEGTLTPELRQTWLGLKLDLKLFVIRGWEMAERWEAFCTQNTDLAWCTGCAAEVRRFPWEETATILCLDCARQQLEDEDDPVIQEVLPREGDVRSAARHSLR